MNRHCTGICEFIIRTKLRTIISAGHYGNKILVLFLNSVLVLFCYV